MKTVRSHIPDDLALCIMSKLPVKSVRGFGCIRKLWALLFENSHFMSTYRNNFISNHHSYNDYTSFLLQTSGYDIHSLSGEWYANIVKVNFPNVFEQEDPWNCILNSGSVNGVLCLYYYNRQEVVALWSPTTNELKPIPPSPFESVPPYQIFDVHLQGFGYDHIRDDYKLIRSFYYRLPTSWDFEQLGMSREDVPWEDISDEYIWEMYSLRMNSWKKLDIDDSVVDLVRSNYGARLYMNGLCLWWSCTYNDPPFYEEKELASFDLVNEVVYTTPIPLDISPLDECDACRYLVSLNGSIALISWVNLSTTFDISILGEHGVKESWTKFFTIGPLSCVEEPIGTGKNGDIFFKRNDGELVWYNLSSQAIRELGIKGTGDSLILSYKENLHPIGGKSLI